MMQTINIMNIMRYTCLLLGLVAAFTSTMHAAAQADESIRVLIQYRDDAFISEALELALEGRIDVNITRRNILAITVRNPEVLERLQQNELVESAQADPRMSILIQGGFARESDDLPIFGTDGDAEEVIPYGIPMVQADQLWDIPEAKEDLIVCVVDTGMDLGHPDLPNVREDKVSGTNTESGNWFQDRHGHGTHTAGTIGAVGDNEEGVVGIRSNPNLFRFHIGKGLNDDGSGYESEILAAVDGCIEGGARVVSMSLGGPDSTDAALEFYQQVYREGILVVAAAGNDGNNGAAYPASYPVVMSVAANDRNETRADFSQCNRQVEISAPGVNVYSTAPNREYMFASGTSMACPHVAGVAAEVWSRFPNCTNSQIRNVLLRSAKPIGDYGCYNGLGSGLVQAKAAYDMLQAEGCEAGGEATKEPTGGCFQNPDFVLEENPYFGECPDSGTKPRESAVLFGASLLVLVAIWIE